MTKIQTHLSKKKCLVIVAILLATTTAWSQEKEKLVAADTLTTTTISGDSTKPGAQKKKRVYNPGKAALYSAILPGLGQIYNKKYWKVPIVYGALGITGGIFLYNYKNYKDTRFAFKAKYNASLPTATAADSALLPLIKPALQRYSIATLQYYRDEYRRDIDYSALFFIIFWGLNVVDAAVDSHLKAFDVSPDLSLRIKPGHSEMAGTNGISLVFNIGKNVNPRPSRNNFIN
jgi:TM2 domain-containing membrane protein YozV